MSKYTVEYQTSHGPNNSIHTVHRQSFDAMELDIFISSLSKLCEILCVVKYGSGHYPAYMFGLDDTMTANEYIAAYNNVFNDFDKNILRKLNDGG
jgi:hypothetical protein